MVPTNLSKLRRDLFKISDRKPKSLRFYYWVLPSKEFNYGVKSKLLRAYGGCLGTERRRKTWRAAKSLGELPSKF